MKKNNVKKLIVCLVAILLVVGVTFKTYATSDNFFNELNEMLQNESGNISNNENAEQIPEGTNTDNVNENLNANVNTNTSNNTNVNENLPSTTPHAGIGSYAGLIFVVIFAVSAVYAYKKIREYND